MPTTNSGFAVTFRKINLLTGMHCGMMASAAGATLAAVACYPAVATSQPVHCTFSVSSGHLCPACQARLLPFLLLQHVSQAVVGLQRVGEARQQVDQGDGLIALQLQPAEGLCSCGRAAVTVTRRKQHLERRGHACTAQAAGSVGHVRFARARAEGPHM